MVNICFPEEIKIEELISKIFSHNLLRNRLVQFKKEKHFINCLLTTFSILFVRHVMVTYLAYDTTDIRFIYLHVIRLKQKKEKSKKHKQLTRRKSIECHISLFLCKRSD